MNPLQWQRVRAVFEQAVELAAREREELLQREFGGDAEALLQVRRLLAAEPLARDYLTPPGDATLAQALPPALFGPRPGDRLGAFTLLSVLGSGGMGTVFEARQEVPARTVALKVMRHGITSERARRRFADEIEVLARLQHPGIAQVYEAGVDGELPWFAMELLDDARPITEFARQQALSLPARLRLLLQVTEAIQHAHQRGVIHRDLKPANILVDAHGRAKVIDFGIARTVATDLERLSHGGTAAGELLGTLLYMSPEQLDGSGDADVRSDVYGLGVVLYELLAERRPFELDGMPLATACRVIAEREPAPLGSVAPSLPREFDWVVQHAMAKERERRYPAVLELGLDLQRLLQNEPVTAAPPHAGYRLRKFLRRHRAGAAAGVLVLLTFAAAFVAVTLALWRARDAEAAERDGRRLAVASATRAEAALDFLLDVFATAAPEKTSQGKDVTMAEALDLAARDLDQRFAAQPEIRAALGRTIGLAYEGLGNLTAAERHLRTALATAEQFYGEAPETARVLVDLSYLQLHSGQPQLAQQSLTRAEAMLQTHANARVALLAEVQRGDLLRATGDRATAAKVLRQAVEALHARAGFDDRDTLLALNLLAGVLHELGDLDAAEPLYRRAFLGLADLKGEDNPQTLSAMNNLALVLFSRHPSKESVAALEHVLRVRRRILGEDHPDTLAVMVNLGGQHYLLGERDEAMRDWQEALDHFAGKLPREHPVIQTLLLNMATVERDRGNHAHAAELSQEILDIRRRTLGDGNDKTLVAMGLLAEVLREDGKLERARQLFEEGLRLAQQKQPPDLANVYRCQLGLGRLATTERRFEAAERALLACRDGYEAAVAQTPVKSMLLRPEAELVRLYEAWGKTDEAARFRGIVDAADYRERTGTAR